MYKIKCVGINEYSVKQLRNFFMLMPPSGYVILHYIYLCLHILSYIHYLTYVFILVINIKHLFYHIYSIFTLFYFQKLHV